MKDIRFKQTLISNNIYSRKSSVESVHDNGDSILPTKSSVRKIHTEFKKLFENRTEYLK